MTCDESIDFGGLPLPGRKKGDSTVQEPEPSVFELQDTSSIVERGLCITTDDVNSKSCTSRCGDGKIKGGAWYTCDEWLSMRWV